MIDLYEQHDLSGEIFVGDRVVGKIGSAATEVVTERSTLRHGTLSKMVIRASGVSWTGLSDLPGSLRLELKSSDGIKYMLPNCLLAEGGFEARLNGEGSFGTAEVPDTYDDLREAYREEQDR